MADEILDFRLNVGQALSGAKNLEEALSRIDKQIEAFVNRAKRSNSGNLDTALDKAAEAARRLYEQQQKLIQQGQRQVQSLVAAPKTQDLAILARYQGQIERLQQLLRSVDPSKIQQVLDAVRGKGTLTPQQLTAPIRAFVLELSKVQSEAAKAAASLKNFETAAQATARVRTVLRGLDRRGLTSGTPTGASNVAVRQYQNARTALIQLVRESGVAAQRITQINDNLGANYRGVENQIANALEKVRAAHERVTASAQKSAAAQQTALERANSATAGRGIVSALAGSVTGNIDVSSASKANAALERLQQLFNRGRVDSQQYAAAIKALQTGAIVPLTTGQVAAQRAVLQFVSAVQSGGGAVQGFGNVVKGAAGASEQAASQFANLGTIIRGVFIGNALYGGLARLQSALRQSISDAAEFTTKIAEVRTISDDGSLSVEQLEGGLRKLSETFSQDILEVTEAQYQALSNQIGTAAESLEFLTEAGKFSQAAVTKLSTSVNLGTAVINAYNKENSEAKEIFAELFKTIELGRIRADQLGQTFGRILPISNKIGVSTKELNAALATITIQGVPAEEAMTQLLNLFTQLSRPTKALTEVLNQYGATSAQAFIESNGLAAILGLLNERIGGSVENARKFSREIRATNALLNLTGNGFDRFQSNLAQYATATEDAEKATNLVAEALGTRLKRQLDSLNNFFRVDIGKPFLKFLLDSTDAVGGLGNALKVASVAALALVGGAVLKGFGALIPLIIGAERATALWNAVLLANPIIAAGVAGALIGVGVTLAINQLIDALDSSNQKLDEFKEKVKAAGEETKKQFSENLKKESADFKKTLDERLTFYNRYFSALQATNQEILADTVETGEAQTKALRTVFATFSGYIKTLLRDSNSDITKLENSIKQATEKLPDIQLAQTKSRFDRERSLASSPRQTRRIDQEEINFLQRTGKELFDTGNIQDALSRFKEIDSILSNQFQQQVELNREAGRSPRFGIAQIERQITTNYQNQIRLTKEAIAEQERQLALAQRQKDAQELALQNFEKQSRALVELGSKEFVGNFDSLDQAQARIKEISEALRQSVSGFDPSDRLRVVQQVTEFELNARKRALAEFNKVEIEQNRQTLKQKTQDAIAEERKINTRRQDIQGTLTTLREQAAVITETYREAFDAAIASGTGDLLGQLNRVLGDADIDAAAEGLRNKVEQALGQIQQGVQTGTLDKAGAQAIQAELDTALAQLNAALGTNIQAQDSLANIQFDRIQTLMTLLDQYEQQLAALKAANEKFGSSINLGDLEGKFGETSQRFTELYNKINTQTPKIDVDINPALGKLSRLENELNDVLNKTRELSFGSPFGFNYGGHVRQFQSGGLGSDNLIARLKRGEFVVNSEATRSSFTTLNALNAGSGRFAGLTGNSTNIGDINVTVNNPSSPVSGRMLAGEIKRELRKGTIS